MNYELEKKDEKSCLLIIKEDHLNLSISNEFKNLITSLMDEEGFRFIDIDFSLVSHMDSSGLGKLLSLYRKIKAVNGKIRIVKVHPALKEILETLHLDNLFF